MEPASFRIGDLARATGTKVETIRYYERTGLLPQPPRTPGNYRAYESAHMARLGFIRRARDLGFSIEQIRTLLDLAYQRDESCETVDALVAEHLVEVDRKLADLAALRRELAALAGRCRESTIADCRIIQALTPALCVNR